MDNNFIGFLIGNYQKRSKVYNAVALFVLIAVGGFFSYKYFYEIPQEEEAMKAISVIQYKFGETADTSSSHYDLILNGESSKYRGALHIAEHYASTKAGNLAKYYAGYCYYAMENYDKAISYLEDCSIKDDVLQGRAYAVLADAYAEKKSYTKAADLYKKSFELNRNNLLYGPLYSLRAGILYGLGNEAEKSAQIYREALDTYPYELEQDFADKILPTTLDQIRRNLSMLQK